MLLEELIKEEREQALAEGHELGLSEGRELGLTEGISRGQVSSILELLADLGEVPEEIKEAVSGRKRSGGLETVFKTGCSSEVNRRLCPIPG